MTPTQEQIEDGKCPHELWEREASVVTEGYCPICMAERIAALSAAAEVGRPADLPTSHHSGEGDPSVRPDCSAGYPTSEPTDAQLKAAMNAMMYAEMKCGGTPSRTNSATRYIVKAVLAAAAEASDDERFKRQFKDGWDCGVASTIKRCAQVALQWKNQQGLATADAILALALKDAP